MVTSWRTVHKGGCYRFKKAREQWLLPKKSEQDIFDLVKKCMDNLGLDISKFECVEDVQEKGPFDKKFYTELKIKYSMVDVRDIVWMKFTKNKGHLGVVATSNDINFDRPKDSTLYDETTEKGRWVYTTSGIIICELEEFWNDDYVLVFPILGNFSGFTRHKIEKRIGDYLIENDVPIIDFYSHRI